MPVIPMRVTVSDRLAYVDHVVAHDRSAVVAVAIMQIFRTSPPQQWRWDIEAYLRDEFAKAEPAPSSAVCDDPFLSGDSANIASAPDDLDELF